MSNFGTEPISDTNEIEFWLEKVPVLEWIPYFLEEVLCTTLSTVTFFYLYKISRRTSDSQYTPPLRLFRTIIILFSPDFSKSQGKLNVWVPKSSHLASWYPCRNGFLFTKISILAWQLVRQWFNVRDTLAMFWFSSVNVMVAALFPGLWNNL